MTSVVTWTWIGGPAGGIGNACRPLIEFAFLVMGVLQNLATHTCQPAEKIAAGVRPGGDTGLGELFEGGGALD